MESEYVVYVPDYDIKYYALESEQIGKDFSKIFSSGKKFDSDEVLEAEVRKNYESSASAKEWPDCISCSHVPWVGNQKVVKVLSEYNGLFQTVPLLIKENHEVSYSIIHVTNVIDCIDREKTNYTENPFDKDLLTSATNVKFISTKLESKPAIFIAKGLKSIVFVNKELAINLANYLSGFDFYEVAEIGM
tara:strand:- start:7 stop:576 length:570 start_codon:yes stop_codon:yes gene_type:complete